MHLRSACESDLSIIISWIADADDCKLWAGPHVSFPLSSETLKAQISYAPENSFCLEKDGEVVAFGQLIPKDRQRLHLARIIVNPAEREKGFGQILCEQIIARAVDQSCRWITLNVYENNVAAMNLYKHLGFEAMPPPAEELPSDEVCFLAISVNDTFGSQCEKTNGSQ